MSGEDFKKCRTWCEGPKTRNFRTNRKIKKGGPTYEKLEKECAKKEGKCGSYELVPKKRSFSIDACRTWCAGDKKFNFITGRKIKKGKGVYKKLSEDCARRLGGHCGDHKSSLEMPKKQERVAPIVFKPKTQLGNGGKKVNPFIAAKRAKKKPMLNLSLKIEPEPTPSDKFYELFSRRGIPLPPLPSKRQMNRIDKMSYDKCFKGFDTKTARVVGRGFYGAVYIPKKVYGLRSGNTGVLKIQKADYSSNQERNNDLLQLSRFFYHEIEMGKKAFGIGVGPKIKQAWICTYDKGVMMGMEMSKLHKPYDPSSLSQTKEAVKVIEKAAKKGLVHLDLHYGNLMFDKRGHAKLIDFGLSKYEDRPPTWLPAFQLMITSLHRSLLNKYKYDVE